MALGPAQGAVQGGQIAVKQRCQKKVPVWIMRSKHISLPNPVVIQPDKLARLVCASICRRHNHRVGIQGRIQHISRTTKLPIFTCQLKLNDSKKAALRLKYGSKRDYVDPVPCEIGRGRQPGFAILHTLDPHRTALSNETDR